LIDAARHAPSAGDTQPWEFIVVKDKSVKERLAETHAFSDFVADAPVCVVVLANEKISPNYFAIDVACAIENLLIASHCLGLGACWVAVYDPLNPSFERHVRSVLNVPSHLRVIAMVPVGYPNEKVEPRKLRDLDQIVHNEKY
jgi:nitroreductase